MRMARPRLKQRWPVGGGVHHHVDGKRDHRTRPFGRRPEHQVERHRETMVDLHLVDDGEVETVEDHRLGDVGSQRRMALDHRHRARAPAFVGGRKFRRAAECEGRDQVHRKRRGMVVIDFDDDVRLGGRHPRLGSFEAGKHPLPVRLLGLLVVDRGADGRHVRRSHACDDSSHVAILLCCRSN